MTDPTKQAARALRQVADHYENRAYRRSLQADHQYDPEETVRAAHCPMAALNLTIHGIEPEEAEELLRRNPEYDLDHPIWERIDRATSPERKQTLRLAGMALIEETHSWPAYAGWSLAPQFVSTIVGRHFKDAEDNPRIIAWLRAAARRLEQENESP